jgi:hypothetical protein
MPHLGTGKFQNPENGLLSLYGDTAMQHVFLLQSNNISR